MLEEIAVVTIDLNTRWDGTCSECNRYATVFAVRFSNGAWGRHCKPCAGDVAVMA